MSPDQPVRKVLVLGTLVIRWGETGVWVFTVPYLMRIRSIDINNHVAKILTFKALRHLSPDSSSWLGREAAMGLEFPLVNRTLQNCPPPVYEPGSMFELQVLNVSPVDVTAAGVIIVDDLS